MSGDTPVTGLAVVDKAPGMTSHQVVGVVRRMLGQKKVGHAGTLDPDATGVLVLGLGRATRLLRFITGASKTYEATIRLGVETSTLDAAGEVTATHDMIGPTSDQLEAAVDGLTGDILQVPPMVSAIRVGGKRLHQLARQGVEVERKPRPVTIHRFDIAMTDDPMLLTAEVDCSSGTYIRTLAADLGTALGGGAHLESLRRTRVGDFHIGEAHPAESMVVVDPIRAVGAMASVVVDAETAADIGVGKVLPLERLGVEDTEGPWAVVDEEGQMLAIYEPFTPGLAKPDLVLAASN